MPCLVGITTDLETKKNQYVHDYPTLSNWQVFGPFDSMDDARNWQDDMTEKHGCHTNWSATGYFKIPEQIKNKNFDEITGGSRRKDMELQELKENAGRPSAKWYGYMFEY
jgi:hypothetical protein